MFNAMTAQVTEALAGPTRELNERLDRIAELLEALLAVESAKMTATQARSLAAIHEGMKAAKQ